MTDIEEEERQHFKRILNAFKAYRWFTYREIGNRESYIKSMPKNQQELLESYRKHLDQQKICVDHNVEIIKLIIKDVSNMFANVQHKELDETPSKFLVADIDKIHSTFKQFVRDWSETGKAERALCYDPILHCVDDLYKCDPRCKTEIQILVPGAGLGRLAYEFARRGYSCQGNEFSLFMLFASHFVLNKTNGVNNYHLYPWVHATSNVMKSADQLESISFPDVDPSDLPSDNQFTMAAGDFLEVYTENSVWDCIATCFFIDCANNIVAFTETIYNILKPGGYWINLGPLLYHFANDPMEKSIELSYEELRNVILKIGFILLKEETGLKTSYTHNIKSMLKYEYESVFFVAKKPE